MRQIHRQLPPGGILVFVTGQREVEQLVRRLRTALAPRATEATPPVTAAATGRPAADEVPPCPDSSTHSAGTLMLPAP